MSGEDFTPASKLMTERPDLFEHLSPEKRAEADRKVSGMMSDLLWDGNYAELFDKLQSRGGDERKYPRIEISRYIGSGTFALVLGGKINGISTDGTREDDGGAEHHAVIRLVKRGNPIADALALDHPLVLAHAHREVFRPFPDDPAGWWVSVVPWADFSGVRESDVFRTGRLFAQQDLAPHFGDFGLGQYAFLVSPKGERYQFPNLDFAGNSYPARDNVVVADRNSVVASTAGLEGFLEGTGGLDRGLTDLASRMYIDLRKLERLPNPVLETLLNASAEAQLTLLAGITQRFGISQEPLLDLAQIFNASPEFLVDLAEKTQVSPDFLRGVMDRFPLTEDQVHRLKEQYPSFPTPPTRQEGVEVAPAIPEVERGPLRGQS